MPLYCVIMKSKKKTNKRLLYKEIIFSVLALLSVFLLIFEYFGSPEPEQISKIYKFDLVVAIIFLVDFLYQLYNSKNKRLFMKHNWYLLLASIPVTEGWAEVLRGLRILSLVRLLRATEHVHYVEKNINLKRLRR